MFGQQGYDIKQGYDHPVGLTTAIISPMAPFTGIYNM